MIVAGLITIAAAAILSFVNMGFMFAGFDNDRAFVRGFIIHFALGAAYVIGILITVIGLLQHFEVV